MSSILEEPETRRMVSHRCLKRILAYKTTLISHKDLGFEKIYSRYLASVMGITGAQVRKDFSLCRINGRKKGGYDINSIIGQIDSFIHKSKPRKAILAGLGNLGMALMKYQGFKSENISLEAAFDIDPCKINRKNGFPVYPVGNINGYVAAHDISIGIITVPGQMGNAVFKQMVDAGIKGVLNFAPCWLCTPDPHVVVRNMNLAQELECLAYEIEIQSSSMEPGVS